MASLLYVLLQLNIKNGVNTMQQKFLYFVLLAFSTLSFAQFTATTEMNSYADDNLFRSPEPVSDVLSNIGLKLNYQPQNSELKFYYAGTFYFYRDYSERNFLLQSLGVNAFHPFGKEERHGFYYGADFALRINGQQYDYYNYSQLYAYASLNFDLDFMFFKTGYNFRYRSYANLPDLTNYRHYIFAQVNKSFATKTTLILETDLGNKSFAGKEISPLYSEEEWGMRGRGRHMEQTFLPSQLSVPSMTHIVLLARVAQSIHPKVGVYVQYRKQISLTEQTDFINSTNYYQDEELYDDPFSYESDGVSGQFTWILPYRAKLQIGIGAVHKNYISEQAFVSADDSVGSGGLRTDDNRNVYVSLMKTFYFKKSFLQAVEFNLNYNYISNKSNSYWYDYHNTIFGGGISWKF